jgi:hypothetical protein
VAHPAPSVRFKQFFSVTKAALQELGRGELYEWASDQAMVDLVRLALRCPELNTALWSIAAHSLSGGDMASSVSEIVETWLDEEAFRSL